MSTILDCRGLTKRYGNKLALDHIDLSLDRGKIIGLLGPNGSGKTTLIKLLNGLLVPTEGEIFVDGKAPGVETKRIVSYLPERTYLNLSLIHISPGFIKSPALLFLQGKYPRNIF